MVTEVDAALSFAFVSIVIDHPAPAGIDIHDVVDGIVHEPPLHV